MSRPPWSTPIEAAPLWRAPCGSLSRPSWPRSRRFSDRVLRLVGLQLQRSADLRLHAVTLTRAEVSGDFGMVRLYYLVGQRPGGPQTPPEETQGALRKAQGYLRSKLAEDWEYRKVPEIRFLPDRAEEAAAELQQALDSTEQMLRDRDGDDEGMEAAGDEGQGRNGGDGV